MNIFLQNLEYKVLFRVFLYFVIGLPGLPLMGQDRVVIQLGHGVDEVYVVREYVEYFVDSSLNKLPDEMFHRKDFQRVDKDLEDFINSEIAYAYWIRFSVVNLDPGIKYRLEMFDHDIDEVSLYVRNEDHIFESHSGYLSEFGSRDLYHKNIGFFLSLPKKDTITYLLRFRSGKTNVLEPVIRSLPAFYKYSLIEYTLLGFFYGLTFIIILYNLVYFVILKERKYLYYLLYMLSITIYLMSRNGTGFQFFWPDIPSANYYVEFISSTSGVSFLLLFTSSYLGLYSINKKGYFFLLALLLINLLTLPLQILHQTDIVQMVIAILFVQIAFGVTIIFYLKRRIKTLWFLLGFVILDIGFIISWLEYIDGISSSIFTVYFLYLAVNLQFIFISIGLAHDIKQIREEKNKALINLLAISDNNQMMRILALKKQMSPHFIFNALNSILQRILSGSKDDASEYLVKFSRLIRKTMEQSDIIFTKLSDELESLKIYLSLEAMRLGNSFSYNIEVNPSINPEREVIPAFIIQPFVENAVWHGLMPKQGDKFVSIRIEKEASVLAIIIEDNGIGRTVSAKRKKQHQSTPQGINLIRERLELLNKKYHCASTVEIQDLYDTKHNASGTRIIIKTDLKHEQLHQSDYSRR
ncbi:MAG: 7TM diverse intracellular signaling domain-containing protein [Cytophagaceae bacterium]